FIEGAGPAVSPDAHTPPKNADVLSAEGSPRSKDKPSIVVKLRSWTGPTWARIWSVWGFVLSSAIVWSLAPAALSSARLDGVRGALGMVGWALFAFASAGPVLRA